MGGFPYNKEQSCPIPSPPPSAQARGRLGWQVGDSAGAVPACEGEESACVRTPFCSLSLSSAKLLQGQASAFKGRLTWARVSGGIEKVVGQNSSENEDLIFWVAAGFLLEIPAPPT